MDVNSQVLSWMIHNIMGKLGPVPVPGNSGSGEHGRDFVSPHIQPGSSHSRQHLPGNLGQTRVGAPVVRCSFVPEDVVPQPGQRQGEDARRSTERCLRVGPAVPWTGRCIVLEAETSGAFSAGQD